ncbi:hypothetical protein E2C01_063301 [Portunus trituberculatus]|uniref:Uncharacterized protein n=1 Tax=Portunus trituberculatus TaxID=210409 RepID=A0A5B7HGP5_PORTR|nr:hypothetical protein [Portunus trituberculatus]
MADKRGDGEGWIERGQKCISEEKAWKEQKAKILSVYCFVGNWRSSSSLIVAGVWLVNARSGDEILDYSVELQSSTNS